MEIFELLLNLAVQGAITTEQAQDLDRLHKERQLQRLRENALGILKAAKKALKPSEPDTWSVPESQVPYPQRLRQAKALKEKISPTASVPLADAWEPKHDNDPWRDEGDRVRRLFRELWSGMADLLLKHDQLVMSWQPSIARLPRTKYHPARYNSWRHLPTIEPFQMRCWNANCSEMSHQPAYLEHLKDPFDFNFRPDTLTFPIAKPDPWYAQETQLYRVPAVSNRPWMIRHHLVPTSKPYQRPGRRRV